ncbi:phage antirepressor KilAC domain-containing protein [Catenulispora sp. NL8]|uniref:Phage antirepressor KilAC domain-containing protein n=1 Tax=Catenulispora pinistramenti TaxID=2705254 RepID=A0ABS5L849_9ACTN|nr:BRO family protein [Catenulispora pinistramenti]MBS2554543.1 phage antirepressor KilAC domain-containing protein [Catenulispora pinistramenti]
MSTGDIALFDFEGRQVRVIIRDDQPWFVASDIARVLGYADPNDAVARHVDHDDISSEKINTASDLQDPVIRRIIAVNESGLYSLIFGSKLPAAKAFRRWVTAVVLPTIRRTGGVFIAPDSSLAHAIATDPTAALAMAANVLGIAQQLQEQNQALADKNTELVAEHVVIAPKAAAYDAFFDSDDTCSVRDAARMLRRLFSIGENELRDRMRRRWRWVEVHSTAATAYATGRGYMVNHTHVNEFGPCPSSGRLTAKGFRRLEAKLRKELPPERHLQPTPSQS